MPAAKKDDQHQEQEQMPTIEDVVKSEDPAIQTLPSTHSAKSLVDDQPKQERRARESNTVPKRDDRQPVSPEVWRELIAQEEFKMNRAMHMTPHEAKVEAERRVSQKYALQG